MFTLQLRVLAASIPSLPGPSGQSPWPECHPRLEVILGEVRKDAGPTTWDPEEYGSVTSRSQQGPSSFHPSGRECPWRFGSLLTFALSIDDLAAGNGHLELRLSTETDINLGPLSLQLPRTSLGQATVDLRRHVIPICSAVKNLGSMQKRFESTVQMVALASLEAVPMGSLAVVFELDADPVELFAAVAAADTARLKSRRKRPSDERGLEWLGCCGSSFATSGNGHGQSPLRRSAEEGCPGYVVGAELRGRACTRPPPLPSPELSPDGWVCRHGPGGRVFWHHKDLGPPPWEKVPASLTDDRSYMRSLLGRVADLSDA
ncbi:unnamed protein product [Polarella glacialis]|uniref:WW domain-containing protein n=1 Tax=Polarella glacialis TaxID=89957 RepID=A0A813FEL8_POLGL|nr:unnamed protein product [Polarella glacialis]